MTAQLVPHVIKEIQIFVSYAREDRGWFAEDSLIPWLKRSLEKSQAKLWWDTTGIIPGEEVSKRIAEQIDASPIAILLVTEEFLNSKYINEFELPRIAQRANEGKMWVVPILLEPCQWERSEFLRERNVIPISDGKPTPLVAYRDNDHQWTTARNETLVGIEKAIRHVCAASSPSVSKSAYLTLVSLCIAGIFGLTGYFVFIAMRHGMESALPVLAFVAVPHAVLGITSLTLVYKMWAALRNNQPRVKPARAVLGLLVPLFNIYWCFPVFLGFARDYNKCVKQNNLRLPILSERFFLVTLLLGISTMIPFVGSVTLIPALGLYAFLVGKICDAINGLSIARASALPDFVPIVRRKSVTPWAIAASAILLIALVAWKVGWIGPRPDVSGIVQPIGPIIEVPPTFLLRTGWHGNAGVPSSADLENARAQLIRRPNDVATLNDVGSFYVSAGRLEEGLGFLSKALSLAPRNPDIGYNYARGLYQQGKSAEALNQLEASITQRPGFDEAQLLAAAIDVENGRLASAEGRLGKLVKAGVVIARVIQGAIALKRGRVAEGLAIFQSLLAEDPTNSLSQYNAAVANQQNRNFAEAQRLYRGALETNPHLAQAHYNLGTLLTQTNQIAAARNEFGEAIRLRPELGKNFQQKTTNKKERLNPNVATSELLRSLDLVISRIVYGQTASELRQAVTVGNVEAGFVASASGVGDTMLVQVGKRSSSPHQVLNLSLAPGSILVAEDPNIRPLVVIGIRGRRVDESHYIPGSTIEIAGTPSTYIVSVVRLTARGVDAVQNTPFALSQQFPDPRLACIASKIQAISVGAAQAAVLIHTQRLTHAQAKNAMNLDDGDWAAAQAVASSCM